MAHRDESEYNRKHQPLGSYQDTETRNKIKQNELNEKGITNESNSLTDTQEVHLYIWPDSTLKEITNSLKLMRETPIGKALIKGAEVCHALCIFMFA